MVPLALSAELRLFEAVGRAVFGICEDWSPTFWDFLELDGVKGFWDDFFALHVDPDEVDFSRCSRIQE